MRSALLLTLALAACAGPTEIKGSGILAPSPEGYVRMCEREPSHPLCQRTPQ